MYRAFCAFPHCISNLCLVICGFKIAIGKKSKIKTECVHTYMHTHTDSQFSLFVVIVLYRVTINIEFTNSKPLSLEEI